MTVNPVYSLQLPYQTAEGERLMTMKEVEHLLEIPRATVRFYEKEGLVSPDRGGNGYRNYTDENGKPYDSLANLFGN